MQVLFWDGSVLDLTSNDQTLEFTALPPAAGSLLDAWAAIAWTADSTLQIASDDHPVTIEDTIKKLNDEVREHIAFCAEHGIPTAFKDSILDSMDDPFAQVKDYIDNEVNFAAFSPTQTAALTHFRDVELDALRVDMSQKLTDLTLEHLIHQATAKTDAAGKMKELLDNLSSIDISLAGEKTLEITPVVGFDFNDIQKDALLNVDLPVIRDVLDKPHKLFSELGLSGEMYFDTVPNRPCASRARSRTLIRIRRNRHTNRPSSGSTCLLAWAHLVARSVRGTRRQQIRKVRLSHLNTTSKPHGIGAAVPNGPPELHEWRCFPERHARTAPSLP